MRPFVAAILACPMDVFIPESVQGTVEVALSVAPISAKFFVPAFGANGFFIKCFHSPPPMPAFLTDRHISHSQ